MDSKSHAKSHDEKLWATFCHLAGFAGFVVPFGNIIAPLVLWLIKKDELPFVDENGRASLNFQISVTIYTLGAAVLSIILIGLPILIGILILDIVCIIKASFTANKGEYFRYPLSISFIK